MAELAEPIVSIVSVERLYSLVDENAWGYWLDYTSKSNISQNIVYKFIEIPASNALQGHMARGDIGILCPTRCRETYLRR